MSCSVSGCDAEVFIKKRQLCRPCYMRAWKRGNFGGERVGMSDTWHRIERENLSSTGTCLACGAVAVRRVDGKLVCPTGAREQGVKSQHGLTRALLDELLVAAGHACEICNLDLSDGAYCIDHDHRCCPGAKSCGSCVRGILCRTCNVGIGMLRDDPVQLEKAVLYLRRTMSEKSSIYEKL